MTEMMERRTFVCAISIGLFLPSISFAQDLACSSELDVAYLLPLTGPYAITGASILAGAKAAADDVDCSINLQVYDTQSSIDGLFRAVDTIVSRESARIIVAPFSAGIAEKMALSFSDTLFLNLSQKPDPFGSDIPNFLSLPISTIEESSSSSDDPYYTQGYLALELLAGAAGAEHSEMSSYIDHLKSEGLRTVYGVFRFSPDAGAFELAN